MAAVSRGGGAAAAGPRHPRRRGGACPRPGRRIVLRERASRTRERRQREPEGGTDGKANGAIRHASPPSDWGPPPAIQRRLSDDGGVPAHIVAAPISAIGAAVGIRPSPGPQLRANVEIVASASIGIKRIEALHYYVHDLERTRRFFVDKLDFAEIGRSGPELEQRGPPALGGVPGRRRAVRHPPAGRRGRPRLALPAQAPRRRGHGHLRGRGHRAARSRCSTSAAARSSPTSSASRTTAARWRCSRSPRRSATPPSASSSARGYQRPVPGLRRARRRRAAGRTASASSGSITSRRTSRP